MNEYGRTAMEWWRENQLSAFNKMSEEQRLAFFTTLGAEIETEVINRTAQVTLETVLSEDFVTQVGQRNMIRFQVESQVLQEKVYYHGQEKTMEDKQIKHREHLDQIIVFLMSAQWKIEADRVLPRLVAEYQDVTEAEARAEWETWLQANPWFMDENWNNPPQNWVEESKFLSWYVD